jgi:hypothetical protein
LDGCAFCDDSRRTHTWWVLVAGDETGEDASKGIAARPVGAARPRDRGAAGDRETDKEAREKIEMRRVNARTGQGKGRTRGDW